MSVHRRSSVSQKSAAHKLTGSPDPLTVNLVTVAGEWAPWAGKWDSEATPIGHSLSSQFSARVVEEPPDGAR